MRKRDELARGCMAKARDDEMTFVLLARDPEAPGTIRDWIARRIESGMNKPGDAKLVEAEACARVMEAERARSGLDGLVAAAVESVATREILAAAREAATETPRGQAPGTDAAGTSPGAS